MDPPHDRQCCRQRKPTLGIIISTRSRKLSLYRRYQRTQSTMISRSGNGGALKRSSNVQHAWPGSSRLLICRRICRHTHAFAPDTLFWPRKQICLSGVDAQLPRISEETGARFIWRAVYSPELYRPRPDPIRSTPQIGGGSTTARSIALKTSRDGLLSTASRIPEPDWNRVNWRRLALACVVARSIAALASLREQLANPLFSHGKSSPRQPDDDLVDLAQLSGLASHHFIADLAHDETERLHKQNIERALAAGAFGVPTYSLRTPAKCFSVKTGCPFSQASPMGSGGLTAYGLVRKTDCD